MDLDIVIVGHIAVDRNVLPWGVLENALGGAPTYAGFALAALRKKVGIISKVGRDFLEMFPPLYSKFGLDTEGIHVVGDHTTTFENIYDELGNRRQTCKHAAPALEPEDIPAFYFGARGFYVSPIVNEVSPKLLEKIKKENNLVMLDPQGLFRRMGAGGEVKLESRDDLEDFLAYVDIVKLGMEEKKVFKGTDEEILEGLVSMGPRVAIITQGEGDCLFMSGGKFTSLKSFRTEVKDTTGAGDVFGAAFFSRYLDTKDLIGSIKFGSAAASLKIRYRGPTGFPSEDEILRLVGKS
jgi:sugar/nucleoside kinase (ribokinase family)